jgi:hypothetical protein
MKKVNESMSFDDVKNFIPSDKLQRIEGGEDAIEDILPTLNDQEQRYLEYIASERYKEVIKKLERMTGTEFDTQDELYPVLGSAMALLVGFRDAEKQHKDYLETLAVQVVLDLPQFKKLKELYDQNEIIFDVLLGTPTINLKDEEPEEEKEIEAEEAELEIADSILEAERLKRRFANMMIQGGSVSYFDVFRMVQTELEQIQPGIANKYAIFMGIVDTLYWVAPKGGQGGAPELGANEIDEDDHGIPVIRAQGVIFPVLVHEIIKAALELIADSAADVEDVTSYAAHLQARKDIDKLESETFDIMIGPALWKRLQSLIDINDQEYLADVFKKILQLPVSHTEKSVTVNKFKQAVHTILQNNNQAKALIDSLIRDIKHELEEFDKQEWKDIEASKGYNDDEGYDDGYGEDDDNGTPVGKY